MIKPYKRNPIKTTNRRPTNYSRLPHVASLSSPTRCSYSFSFHLHDRCHTPSYTSAGVLAIQWQRARSTLDSFPASSWGAHVHLLLYSAQTDLICSNEHCSVLLCSNKNIITYIL